MKAKTGWTVTHSPAPSVVPRFNDRAAATIWSAQSVDSTSVMPVAVTGELSPLPDLDGPHGPNASV